MFEVLQITFYHCSWFVQSMTWLKLSWNKGCKFCLPCFQSSSLRLEVSIPINKDIEVHSSLSKEYPYIQMSSIFIFTGFTKTSSRLECQYFKNFDFQFFPGILVDGKTGKSAIVEGTCFPTIF